MTLLSKDQLDAIKTDYHDYDWANGGRDISRLLAHIETLGGNMDKQIAEVERLRGTLNYLKVQAENGTLHNQVVIQSMLEDAFVAGFDESREGYNGEYPYSAEAIREVRKDLKSRFNEWLKEARVTP